MSATRGSADGETQSAADAPAPESAHPGGELTLGEILALPVVRGGLPQLLVGGDRLSRPVRWTHVLDLPDPRRLLRGGELVLTTGYGMPEAAAGRREWVERIVEQDAAALVVELGLVYPSELPAGIAEACEAAELPLVVLRRRVAFVELTRAVNTAIVHRAGMIAELVSAVQSELIDMLAHDRSTGEMLDAVAERIRVPLVLEGAGRDIVHCAFGGSDESDVFRAVADLHRYEARGVGDTALAAALPRGDGRLVALELETPLGPEHRAILTAAAQAISLDLGRGRTRQLNATSVAQFLEELAVDGMPARSAEERAALLGFRPARGMVALVVRCRIAEEDREAGSWAELAAQLRLRLDKRGLRSLLGASGEQLIGLVETVPEGGEPQRAIVDAARELCAERGIQPDSAVLVLAPECRGWREAGRRLARAARRARIAELLEPRDWYDAGEADLGDLLYEVRDAPALAQFVAERLGPLTDGGARSAVGLETLAALVAHGGRKAGAAKALHLDRSALYQRIRRIEEALGCDLDDPRTLASVHVALEAHALLRRYPPG